MEIESSYIDKFRPRASKKSGEPRTQREEVIDQIRIKLNVEQARDIRPLYTFARVAKRLEHVTDSGLYSLYNECSEPGVRSFGAMLTYKLKRKAN